MVGLVYGLAQGQPEGWSSPATLLPLAAAVVFAGLFVLAERRAAEPLIDAKMFDHLNFIAATISQLIAGMLELVSATCCPSTCCSWSGSVPSRRVWR